MTDDLGVFAPFIAAILAAAAILVVDFIAARAARARRWPSRSSAWRSSRC